MVLGEQVTDWVEGGNNTEHHHDDDFLVWSLVLTQVRDVLSDVMGHLWGRGWGAVIVLNHTVVELRGHGNNHMIVVWIEVTTLWDIETEGR